MALFLVRDLSTRHVIQASPFRLGLDDVTRAEINPSRTRNNAICISVGWIRCNVGVTVV